MLVVEGADTYLYKDNYLGPVQWFADTNNNGVYTAVIDFTAITNRTNFSIGAFDLQKKHICIGIIEDSTNVTLEFEMIRHFEGIASD